MASVVGQTVAQREQPQREGPPVETHQPAVPSTDEDDVDEEVSCFKEAAPDGNGQLELSNQQQRDVAVLMADTPSPAPSVISIRSELTDGEDEREDEDPHLHQ